MLKKWYFWLLMSVVFCLSLVATLLFWPREQKTSTVVTLVNEDGQLEETVVEVPLDPQRERYLVLLGHGGAGHAGGGLADTIIVAQVMPKIKRINLISLPRDLWVCLPLAQSETSNDPLCAKINTTLSIGNSERLYSWRPERFQGKHGGGTLAKEVVSQVIGQEVEYYAAVDFSGFIRLIDLVAGPEGLKINVPYSFVDEFYPIEGEEDNNCDYSEEEIAQLMSQYTGYELEQQFKCRYETLEFNQGVQMIDSQNLLKFVRSRHSGVGGGDFGRSQRQQVVIQALKDKVFSLSFLPKLPEFLATVMKIMQTDLDLDLLYAILNDWGDLREYTITSYVVDNKELLHDGRSRDGQYVLLPRAGEENYSQIQDFVRQIQEESLQEASGASMIDE